MPANSRRKASKGKKKASKGNPKNNNVVQDDITGLTMSLEGIIIEDGVTYTHETEVGRALLMKGQNSGATDELGRRLALEDPLTGYRSLQVLPVGASYKWKFEFDENYLVGTGQYFSGNWTNTTRIVYKGDYTYSGKRMASFSLNSVANVIADGYKPNAHMGTLDKLESLWSAGAPFTNASFNYPSSTSLAYYRDVASVADMPALLSFEGGRFFYPGWEADPFSKDLV